MSANSKPQSFAAAAPSKTGSQLFTRQTSPQSQGLGIRETLKQDTPVSGKPYRRLGVCIAVLLLTTTLIWLSLPLFAAWFANDTLVSRTTLRIAEVTRGPLVRDIAVQGSVVAAHSPTLFAPTTGQISLLVEAGEQVKQGDLLAKIDSPELRNTFAQEQATLNSMDTALERLKLENQRQQLLNKQQKDIAALNLKSARREFQRAQQSWQQRLISGQDFAAAEDTYQKSQVAASHLEAETQLKHESLVFDLQAKQQERQRQALRVEEVQRQLEALNITSPVTGMVGEWLTQQRARVVANTPLLSVVDLSAFEVDARVAENYGSQLRVGMPAELKLPSGQFAAVIRNIAPQVEGGQVALRLRFNAGMPPGLRQNQRLNGRIIMQEIPQTLRVKRGGFLQTEGGNFAYKVGEEKAERVPIRIGAISINHVEILSGLAEGDKIIISSTQEFSPAPSLMLVNY